MIQSQLSLGALAVLVASVAGQNSSQPLVPLVYNDLPLGSISPNGWLRGEMETEANGLAGHLHDFYEYIHESSWLGGTYEYSNLNEALPYWLNGLVPLAYGLDDARLKEQVHSSMDYLMAHMIADDGWVGPEANGPGGGARLVWGRTYLFLGWVNLADANETWTEPIVNALQNFSTLLSSMLKDNCTGEQPQAANTVVSPGDYLWGRARAQDMMYTLQWLHDKHPQGKEADLLNTMELLNGCAYHWEDWYAPGVYPTGNLYDMPDSFTNDNYQFLHGVNVGEGLKAPAVVRRFTHNDSLIQTAQDGVDWTMKYHGSAYGSVLADEREDGLTPWTGSELCTAVETMWSLGYNYRALGASSYADGAELAAFNALPGALTGDWWAHQYMSEANQPFSKNLSKSPFYNDDSVSQTYSLEPDYPCCTVNHPQGLPKFLQSTFVSVGESGILHALLSPAMVTTQIQGSKVTVDCQTNYPFGNILNYQVQADGPFDFYVRVPTWATSATISSGSTSESTQNSDGLLKMSLPKGSSTLVYNIGTEIRTAPRANDTVAVYHGQLLYSLYIGAENTSTGPHNWQSQELYPADYAPPDSRDYTILNTTEWNVAIDPSTLKYNPGSDSLPSPIFAHGAPPMNISVTACQIDWPLLLPGSVPSAPPVGDARKCLGPTFQAYLVPYGSAKLRITELPTMDLPT